MTFSIIRGTYNRDYSKLIEPMRSEGVKKMSIQKCFLRQVDEGRSEELRRMFNAWRTKAFDDVELLRALAHRPELMKVIFAFMKYLYVDSSVDATLMEMLRVKSAWAAKCRH